MRLISEVCKLTGVTRRTLQEYNKIGLLHYSSKTEGGYWQYDDDAISKLYLIQIFVHLGYSRNDIKALVENPSLDIMEEYQKAIYKLTEQRKEIDGMINLLRAYMIMPQIPPKAFKSLSDLNVSDLVGELNFSEGINDSVKKLREVEYLEDDEAKPFVALGIMIAGIALFRHHSYSSEEVQDYIQELYEYMIELFSTSEEALSEEERLAIRTEEFNPDLVSEVISQIMTILDEPEYKENLNKHYGNGTIEFAKEALIYFVESKGGTLYE